MAEGAGERRPGREPRRGLVLGAGGVLGAAWTVGALRALEEATGFDPRTAEVVVGTSAGSVLAAFIGCGISTQQMADHQRGSQAPDDPAIAYDYDRERSLPPTPRWGRFGSRSLLAATARHPRRMPPMTALAAVLPAGRGSIAPVGALVESVQAVAAADEQAVRSGATAPDGWPTSPPAWIVTLDYESGRRVVFGRPGAPSTSLADAVMASCSIPGWYAPVTIDGRRYVDGGACSATSCDLVTSLELDEVYVLAPMASFEMDAPTKAVARLERRLRRVVTRRLLREAAKVRGSGARVTMLAPGPEDLTAIGANMMNARRRLAVFETSLRTSATALGRAGRDDAAGAMTLAG